MRVVGLYIYPFKGGPAVAVDGWETTSRGFLHDRRYMVTNPAGQFMTQRSHPALGQPNATLDGDAFVLDTPDLGELRVGPPNGATTEVQVWSDRVRAVRCGDEADAWFSALVGAPAQLVYMPDTADRPTDEHPDIPLSFADGYPYLIANTASLADLNARIPGAPVPMAAFRPSIVIDGADAWAEDDWTSIRIGEAVFELTTNCERCSVTTLDPAFPDRPRRDGEPLRTLAKFRRNARGKVDFARNAVARTLGRVSLGDEVAE